MKRFILVLAFMITACGADEGAHKALPPCPEKSIDPFFEPNLDFVRELLIERASESMPVERLDLICKFSFVNREEMLERGDGRHLFGLTIVRSRPLDGKINSIEMLIRKDQTPLQMQHTIYHEIMHAFYKGHDDRHGLMQISAKKEDELDQQKIDDLVRQAIFDEDYQSEMIIR